VRLLEDPALLEAELERRLEAGRETDPQRRRLAELQGERERLERAGARLVTAYQEELIGLDELRSRMPAMRSRKRVLEAELEAIETAAEERERYLQIAETLESFRDRLRAGSESLNVIERQKVLRSLVKEVLVDDGEITIRHSIPVTESASPSNAKPAADLPQRNPTPQSYLLGWGSVGCCIGQEARRTGLLVLRQSKSTTTESAIIRVHEAKAETVTNSPYFVRGICNARIEGTRSETVSDEKAQKILKGLNQCQTIVGGIRVDARRINDRLDKLDLMIEELRQELAIELADEIQSRPTEAVQ